MLFRVPGSNHGAHSDRTSRCPGPIHMVPDSPVLLGRTGHAAGQCSKLPASLLVVPQSAVFHHEGGAKAPEFQKNQTTYGRPCGSSDGRKPGGPKTQHARDTKEGASQITPSDGRHDVQSRTNHQRPRGQNLRAILGESGGRGGRKEESRSANTMLRKKGSSCLVKKWTGVSDLSQLLGDSAQGMWQTKRKLQIHERKELEMVNKRRKTTGMAMAVDIVKGGHFQDKLKKFKAGFFSASSRRSRECKREEVMRVALAVTNGRPVVPLQKETLEAVATAMKEAGMRSAVQYLVELKLLHVEAGFDWSAPLQRSWSLCKRSLEREKGPAKRAAEVKVKDFLKTDLDCRSTKKGQPEWPKLAFMWATIWMLREIELRNMKASHIRMMEKEKEVSIWLPLSKCDQTGRGIRRTLACCGSKDGCLVTCPWKIATQVLRKSRKFNSWACSALIKTSGGGPPTNASPPKYQAIALDEVEPCTTSDWESKYKN